MTEMLGLCLTDCISLFKIDKKEFFSALHFQIRTQMTVRRIAPKSKIEKVQVFCGYLLLYKRYDEYIYALLLHRGVRLYQNS